MRTRFRCCVSALPRLCRHDLCLTSVPLPSWDRVLRHEGFSLCFCLEEWDESVLMWMFLGSSCWTACKLPADQLSPARQLHCQCRRVSTLATTSSCRLKLWEQLCRHQPCGDAVSGSPGASVTLGRARSGDLEHWLLGREAWRKWKLGALLVLGMQEKAL